MKWNTTKHAKRAVLTCLWDKCTERERVRAIARGENRKRLSNCLERDDIKETTRYSPNGKRWQFKWAVRVRWSREINFFFLSFSFLHLNYCVRCFCFASETVSVFLSYFATLPWYLSQHTIYFGTNTHKHTNNTRDAYNNDIHLDSM